MDIDFTNIAQILSRIEELAPTVWNIYNNQVSVEAFQMLFMSYVFGGILAILILVFLFSAVAVFAGHINDRDFWGVCAGWSGFFMLCFAVLFTWFFVYSRMISMNPEYYAIRLLLGDLGLR